MTFKQNQINRICNINNILLKQIKQQLHSSVQSQRLMSVVLQLQILKSNGSQAVVKLLIATQCLDI